MKKFVSLILLCSLVLVCASACAVPSNDGEETTVENNEETTERITEGTTEGTTEETTQMELNDNMTDKEKFISQLKLGFNNDDESLKFMVDPFAQEVGLSAVFSMEVEIINGNLCLDGVLYDRVEIIEGSKITYNEFLLGGVTNEVSDEECKDIISKLKGSQICYMLETKDDNVISNKIAVYNIDISYYFVSFYDSDSYEAIRIHYATTNREDQ